MSLPVNILISLISGLCAVLLLRGYLITRTRLLLWGGLCFAGLTISNGTLIVDLLILPQVDLYPLRLLIAAASMLVLTLGLVVESD